MKRLLFALAVALGFAGAAGGQTTLNVITDHWIDDETAGLSEAAWRRLGVADGAWLQFSHPAPAESASDLRANEDRLDLWLINGAEQAANDPELHHALLQVAKHKDSRKALVLLGAILETPELVERLTEVLKPAPPFAPPHSPQFLLRFGTWRDILRVDWLLVQCLSEAQQHLRQVAFRLKTIRAGSVIPLLVASQLHLQAQILDVQIVALTEQRCHHGL